MSTYCGCEAERIGVEYAYDDPHHYDGISEWRCSACGERRGRWSGRILTGDEREPRFAAAPPETKP